MTLPKIVSPRRVGGRPPRPARQGEGRPPRQRDRLNTERRELPMVEVTKDYAFEGPDGTVSLPRPLRGSPAADRVPLHVPPRLGRRLPELHGRHRRAARRGSSTTCTRGTRPTPWCRGRRSRSSSAGRRRAAGTIPWYSTERRRLQLRLRRHHRRVTRLRRVQLPHPRRVRRHGRRRACGTAEQPYDMPGRTCFLQVDGRVFRTYSVYARGLESTGGSYYFLDLTALGRQEDWEEPKGRSRRPSAATTRTSRPSGRARPSPGSRAGPS